MKTKATTWLKNHPLRFYFLLFLVFLAVLLLIPNLGLGGKNMQNFWDNLYSEGHGFLVDVIFFGILLSVYDEWKKKSESIDRHKEEIDDYREWKAPEATYRIVGILKRLTKQGITEVNLRGTYLVSANLENLKLKGAILQAANLKNSNLSGTNLQLANIRDANLKSASMRGANLESADLRNSNLRKTDLENAILTNSQLGDVSIKFPHSSLPLGTKPANLRGARLFHTKLQNAQMQNVNLTGANLHHADLSDANLNGAVLKDTRLHCTKFQGANLQKVNFQNTLFSGTDLTGASLLGSNFENATFTGVVLNDAVVEEDWFERLRKWNIEGLEGIILFYDLEKEQFNSTSTQRFVLKKK